MFDKIADKFSKKAVENAKKAVVDDVKQNHTGYIMAGITGIVLAVGVAAVVKAIVSGIPVGSAAVPMYSITNNYYINLPKLPEV